MWIYYLNFSSLTAAFSVGGKWLIGDTAFIESAKLEILSADPLVGKIKI
jgi:hypothetical protein